MSADKIKISDLYPELSPEEQEKAAENLKAYLEVVKRIYVSLSEDERKKLLLRVQWEKRTKNKKSASQK
jgi:hypothetical protein